MKTIKKLLIVILSTLVLSVSVWFFFKKNTESCSVDINKKSSVVSSKSSAKKVFISSESENAEWINKPKDLDLITAEAMNGDRGSLYIIGHILLSGYGMPINTKMANTYFAKSASLGFAPAIDQIRIMYMEDSPNLYLLMVYLNLTIAFGHHEFESFYQEQMAGMREDFRSSDIQNEIEKIATEKYRTILRNQTKLKNATDKKRFFLFEMEDITDLDFVYNEAYWEEIFKNSQKN